LENEGLDGDGSMETWDVDDATVSSKLLFPVVRARSDDHDHGKIFPHKHRLEDDNEEDEMVLRISWRRQGVVNVVNDDAAWTTIAED
jgi:hypothetical protein